jgi:hypothetical protein
VTRGFGDRRRHVNAGPTSTVPDTVAVVGPVPVEAGYGRLLWWERLRSALGLGGLIVVCGVLAAAAVAATLLAIAVLVATAFG